MIIEVRNHTPEWLVREALVVADRLWALYHPTPVYKPQPDRHSITTTTDSGRLAGFLLWSEEWPGYAFIGLAWVDPVYRRQGVYRVMVDQVKVEARQRGFRYVAAGVAPGNHVSRVVHDRLLGATPDWDKDAFRLDLLPT